MTPAVRTKLTPPAIASQWGIDVAKVLSWIRSGELRAIDASTKRGGRPRFLVDVSDLLIFEQSRAVSPPPPRVPRRRKQPGNVIQFF